MEAPLVISIVAVVLSAVSVTISMASARESALRERQRDTANVVLRFSGDGEVVIINLGPNTATGVGLLAGAEGALDVLNVGTLQPGEERREAVRAEERFTAFLSWLDHRRGVNRKSYTLVPGVSGLQGDGWPDILHSVSPQRTATETLKAVRGLGRWEHHEPRLWP